jgi:signal recognition particle receptor subunit beta
VFYEASRKLILKGVDGVVFVADSQEVRHDANIDSVENLKLNLKEHGYDPLTIPYALQLNKRDLPMVLPPDRLAKDLTFRGEPVFEAVATDGTGVFETLKGIIKQVLVDLNR